MKQVVVVASGATEVAALPHLVRHLRVTGVALQEPVRIPPGGHKLRADVVRNLVKAAYWSAAVRPDKFVVLVDADGTDADEAAKRLSDQVESTCGVPPPVLVAAAKWHLEAWFFADEQGLRQFLNRDLGAVDASHPDEIVNPKNHLRHILDAPYTARIAGEIAAQLSAERVKATSPSFKRFVAAMENGHPSQPA